MDTPTILAFSSARPAGKDRAESGSGLVVHRNNVPLALANLVGVGNEEEIHWAVQIAP